jgi:iron complex outermembrane receptor protein
MLLSYFFALVIAASAQTPQNPPANPPQNPPEVREEVIVSATRSGRRVQDEPLRVETLGREEIEEKLMMTPGDIAMMLNETAGLRVQVTAPSLGAASLRIQGLRGRYTQLLSDGLPLYGAQSGSIGLLQIPPMDLGQVEVIKGVASSLFGSSALGGVVNLVSREPKTEPEHELLLNQTTQGGTDAVLWLSGPINDRWGYTLLGNVDHQFRHDVDGDNWADVAEFTRVNVRPRVFWNNGAGRSMFATAGVMTESRSGGTMGLVPSIGGDFVEALDTRRADAGLVARVLTGRTVAMFRGSATFQTHDRRFGELTERDRHLTGFGEASLTGARGAHTWVVGAAVQADHYVNRDAARFDYTYWTPSLFAQDEITFSPSVSASVSARYDQHNRFGAFVSPRVSVLWRPADAWTVRASAGTGYFAPTPVTDETEAAGLARLQRADLGRAETARSASLDVGRAWSALELNATVFASSVAHPLAIRETTSFAGGYDLVALDAPTRTAGAELLAKVQAGEVAIVATHTYVHATEPDAVTGVRGNLALTPRHASGLVVMWEREDAGRAGLEFYYTGRQRLEHNPYRATSRPYAYIGAMVDRPFTEHLRVFVNAENLLDRRQTRYDPLVRPSRNFDGRWTVDAWAPLEGRTVNAGVRWSF